LHPCLCGAHCRYLHVTVISHVRNQQRGDCCSPAWRNLLCRRSMEHRPQNPVRPCRTAGICVAQGSSSGSPPKQGNLSFLKCCRVHFKVCLDSPLLPHLPIILQPPPPNHVHIFTPVPSSVVFPLYTSLFVVLTAYLTN
jgi:hypothetical protein